MSSLYHPSVNHYWQIHICLEPSKKWNSNIFGEIPYLDNRPLSDKPTPCPRRCFFYQVFISIRKSLSNWSIHDQSLVWIRSDKVWKICNTVTRKKKQISSDQNLEYLDRRVSSDRCTLCPRTWTIAGIRKAFSPYKPTSYSRAWIIAGTHKAFSPYKPTSCSRTWIITGMHIAVCSYKPTSCPRALTVARIHNSVYPDNPTSMSRSWAPLGIHNVALSSFISSQNLLYHTKNKSVKHPEQTVAPNSSLKHAAGKKRILYKHKILFIVRYKKWNSWCWMGDKPQNLGGSKLN
jgi:hypothetical protein